MGIWNTIAGWFDKGEPTQTHILPMTDEKNVLVLGEGAQILQDAKKLAAARGEHTSVKIASQEEAAKATTQRRIALRDSDARAIRVLEARKAAEEDRQNLLKGRK